MVMKKVLCSLCAAALMLAGTNAFAQVSLGAGYVNSTTTVTSGSSKTTSPANGFYAGLEFNAPVAGEILGLSAGVNYEYLQSKSYTLGSVLAGDYKEQFLNVPIHVNAGYNLAEGIRLFAFAGPTFSYALSGKVEPTVSLGSFKIGTEYDVYKDSNWNRFDVMVGGGVGLDLMGKFRVTVGYDAGMFNKLPKDSDGNDPSSTITRNKLHAGVAFLF